MHLEVVTTPVWCLPVQMHAAGQIRVSLTLFNLVNQTAAHIHTGLIGSTGNVAVPLPVDSFVGQEFHLSDADTVTQLLAGNAYINIHTRASPAGESH